jgi:cysteine-rich repeat protein
LVLTVLASAVLVSCLEPKSVQCANGLVCPAGTRCASRQDACITTSCGDGVIDPGEVCDDGNVIDGDGCSANCKSNEHCGNGVVDTVAGEQCDDGNVVNGDGCSQRCLLERCGNGILDIGEQCDDGNTDSADGCSSSCKFEKCGNGIIDVFPDGGREACDDGNLFDGDGCSSTCRNERCGNGIVDKYIDGGQEMCDDGNAVSGDGCSGVCLLEACGNGIPDDYPDGGREECDPGDAGELPACNRDCTIRACGDGKLNRTAGEDCDTGDAGDTAGCNGSAANTKGCLFSRCGDNYPNAAAGEQCDDGNNTAGDGCSPTCQNERCGNGVIDKYSDGGQEACDDGNNRAGDGCSPVCVLERCGNGVQDIFPDAGQEMCDDGNLVDGDGCSSACRTEVCGNGIVDKYPDGGQEMCDDGNLIAGDGCSGLCQLEACGNAITDAYPDGGHEDCDPGAVGELAGCNQDCTFAQCGDDKLNATAGEQCDTGPQGDTAACNGLNSPTAVRCQFSKCNDGYVNTAAGEQCDDGNNTAGDGCSPTCQLERCGNAVQDPHEECDPGGDGGDTPGCTRNCKISLCGDSYINLAAIPPEQCDDGAQNGKDGLCSTTCQLERCGDGVVDLDRHEQCDDGNQNNGDGCSATCALEGCGNGTVDPGEQCDDGQLNGQPGHCSFDCRNTGCGNGRVDINEQCDDLPDGGNTASCNGYNCTLSRCGDNYVNSAAGEQCDPGSAGQTAFCTSFCMVSRCGDAFVNPIAGEECDPADAGETSSCTKFCKRSFCGDGYQNVLAGEQCDSSGVNTTTCNSDCTLPTCGDFKVNAAFGEDCDTGGVNTATCNANCKAPRCGDHITNTAFGEGCDDGNPSNADDCLNNCQPNICGDGILNVNGTHPEFCDDGNTVDEVVCPYGQANCTTCNSSCTAALTLHGSFCGDGTKDTFPDGGGEKCDDGNNVTETSCPYDTASCQRCDASCTTVLNLLGGTCGNGTRDLFPDGGLEACDDGNTVDETSCPYGQATCTTCNATCTATLSRTGKVCGNGTIDSFTDGGAEKCDDGNTVSETSCPYGTASCQRCDSNCTTLLNLVGGTCGNGVRDAFPDGGLEPCDDGNTVDETACPYGQASCNTCNATCTAVVVKSGSVCGDGTKNVFTDGGGEKCDDGNTVTETACPYGTTSCTACDSNCSTVLNLVGGTCGDGRRDIFPDGGGEKCDDGNNITETACPYGQANCSLCNSDCSAVLALHGPVCGDGYKDQGEACDDGNTVTETKCDYNVATCSTCNATCSAPLSLVGGKCGDGTRDVFPDAGGEICDDGNIVDETTCPYGPGTCTTCNSTCTATVANTGPKCGDGNIDSFTDGGAEPCDDHNASSCGTCNATCTAPGGVQATGSLTALAPVHFHNGETFTLDDGANPTTTFEFNTTGAGYTVSMGNVAVDISTATDDVSVAGFIAAAINGVGATLKITATGSTATLTLTNDAAGTVGNHAQSETVVDPTFALTPMSGGTGTGCALGVACNSGPDCASGLCVAHLCL